MIVAAACAVLMLALGAAHYAGYAKPLAFRGFFGPYLGLGIAWLGGAGLLSALAVRLSDAGMDVPAAVVMLLALVAFVVALVSIVWLPRFLRPPWLRDWIDRGRPVEEVRRWPQWSRRRTR